MQLEVCARARRKLVHAMDAVTSCFGLRWIGWDLSAANVVADVGGHSDRGAHAALQRRELEPYPPELARGLLQLFSEPPHLLIPGTGAAVVTAVESAEDHEGRRHIDLGYFAYWPGVPVVKSAAYRDV